jgi:Outer membrane protein beta-barrel domain
MDKVIKFAALCLISFLFAVCSNPARAQSEEEEEHSMLIPKKIHIYAGAIVGTNFTQVDGDNFAGYYKIGANIGGIGYVKFTKNWAVSMELLYSQKGSIANKVQASGIDSVYITKYGISVNYAEIPIMINLFDKLKSHIGIGFSYGRLVNSGETLVTAPNYPIDLSKYQFRQDEWEFLAGAQMRLFKGLFLNLRFQYSIVPFRTDIPPNFSRAAQYNNMYTLRLMYLFM